MSERPRNPCELNPMLALEAVRRASKADQIWIAIARGRWTGVTQDLEVLEESIEGIDPLYNIFDTEAEAGAWMAQQTSETVDTGACWWAVYLGDNPGTWKTQLLAEALGVHGQPGVVARGFPTTKTATTYAIAGQYLNEDGRPAWDSRRTGPEHRYYSPRMRSRAPVIEEEKAIFLTTPTSYAYQLTGHVNAEAVGKSFKDIPARRIVMMGLLGLLVHVFGTDEDVGEFLCVRDGMLTVYAYNEEVTKMLQETPRKPSPVERRVRDWLQKASVLVAWAPNHPQFNLLKVKQEEKNEKSDD